MSRTVALGLFSGGLDSILACMVVARQGIEVIGLKFVTPFFDYDLLSRQEEYKAEILEKYGIRVELIDVSEGYLQLLENPVHGFGKNFNPCIDCKILMMTRAKELMGQYGASFLVTGEVLGQRPMSQRRDTLRVIERDSGCEGILLRPLSAKNLEPTAAEQQGLIDRFRLYGFNGRSRKPQKQLARQLGLSEYPNAAGGCILTDSKLANRIQNLYSGKIQLTTDNITVNDIHLLLFGRQFLLDGKYWVIVGRDNSENNRIMALKSNEDWLVGMLERPGPKAMVRYADKLVREEDRQGLIQMVAGLVVRYGKKVEGERPPALVKIDMPGGQQLMLVEALVDEQFKQLQID